MFLECRVEFQFITTVFALHVVNPAVWLGTTIVLVIPVPTAPVVLVVFIILQGGVILFQNVVRQRLRTQNYMTLIN